MRRTCGMVLGCALIVAACGSSDDSSGTAPGGKAGSAGTGGNGGSSAGTGGTGQSGNGGTATTGGSTSTGGTVSTGGTAGAGTGGSIIVSASWTAACENAASVICNLIADCSPFLMTVAYGDQATCITESARRCEQNVTLPGITATPAEYDACIDAYANVTCEDWLTNRTVPAACDLKGSLPEGAGCLEDLQCSTGTCGGATIDGCQQCVVTAGDGEACSFQGPECGRSLQCSSGICEPLPEVGDLCDAMNSCDVQLNCVNGQCAPLQELNDPCSTTLRCDFEQGFTCDPDTSTCVLMTVSKLGEPCDLLCERGTQCNYFATDPVCVAQRQLGETCDTSGALPCAEDLDCVDGTCQAVATIDCTNTTP